MTCVNCGHGSLVKSNFKCLPDGKAYCIQNDKCVKEYEFQTYERLCGNKGARQKGDKPE